MPSIAVNEFVKRQTKKSRFSYFDGTWEELINLAKDNFNSQIQGYRDGVILILFLQIDFILQYVKLIRILY